MKHDQFVEESEEYFNPSIECVQCGGKLGEDGWCPKCAPDLRHDRDYENALKRGRWNLRQSAYAAGLRRKEKGGDA